MSSYKQQQQNNLDGISYVEFVCYLKWVGEVAAVRGWRVVSKNGIRCRHCSIDENFIIETLPRVLGQRTLGSLLRKASQDKNNYYSWWIQNKFKI